MYYEKLDEYYNTLLQEYREGDIYFFLGVIANILLVISLIPTITHVIKINSTHGYPFISIIIKVIVALIWIVYGINRKEEMIVLRSVILLCFFLFFIYMKSVKGV